VGRPAPRRAVVAVAAFVRQRLADLADLGSTVAPLGTRGAGREDAAPDTPPLGTATDVTTVVVGAAGPFAPSSYARARLLRQVHASGLLNEPEANRAGDRADIVP